MIAGLLSILVVALFPLVLWRPAIAAGAVLAMYVVEQLLQIHVPVFTAHPPLFNLLVAGLVGLALLNTRRIPIVPYLGLGGYVGLVMGFAYLSVTWSIDPPISAAHVGRLAPYHVLGILAMPLLITNFDDLATALGTMLVFAAVTLPIMLMTGTWGYRSVIIGDEMVLSPLAVASLAGYAALVAMMVPQPRHLAIRVGWWAMVGVCLWAIVRSGSRGQLIGVFVAYAAIRLISAQLRFRQLVGALLTLALLAVAADWLIGQLGFADRWANAVVGESVGLRISPTVALLDAWRQAPPIHWFIGLGNSTAFSPLTPGVDFYPHFVPGEVLAEEGLIGLALYVLALTATAVTYWRVGAVARGMPDAALARRVEVARQILGALVVFDWLMSLKSGSLIGTFSLWGWVILLGQLHAFSRSMPGGIAPAHERAGAGASDRRP